MSMTKIAGSGSGSTSQRHGSADPDPPQNFMDPEHCFVHVCLMGLKNIRRKNQCFGSRSGLDPDSIRSMNLDPGGQQLPTKIEEISCFQVLDVLFWGLKGSPAACRRPLRPRDTYGNLQFLIKQISNYFPAANIFYIFGHQNSGSRSGLVFSLKCRIRNQWIRIRKKSVGNKGAADTGR